MAVGVAGVALGDMDLHFAWQAWDLVTWIITLRGRRGTWRHRPSLCVAGVALGDMDVHFAWQAWHLWHWAGSGGALGSQLTPLSPQLLARQAWHLATSTFTLRGRQGTWRHGPALCVAGVALMALGWLWWRAWFPVDAVVAAAVGVAGLYFAWQAWHLATSTFTLRGRRGTYGTGLALVARLFPSCRRGCWRGRRGRRGTWHAYIHACMHAYMHTCMHTYHLCHTSSFTYKFAPHNCFYFSILHHILCLSFLPCPATTFVAPYWKKLTCGVIRSFIFEPFLPNSVSLFWGMGSTLDTPKMVLFSRPNLLRGETCSLASWDMDLSEHGGYYKMAMGTVNMMIHHWIIFSLNFQTKPLQITSFPNGQHHAFFRRKVDLWSFVPHYPSPPPGRRYALGLQQGYINPLMQFLLIVHTTHANSGWECSTLFGFGGDDDFYILCIGIHINQAVKEDEVFGNCSNLCGSWNKYERVHNPSTENQGKPHGFL